MFSSLYNELKMSRFLEISKKLSANPSDITLVIDITKIREYFFIFFIVLLNFKELDPHHAPPKDDR